jgi:hypothetical protein
MVTHQMVSTEGEGFLPSGVHLCVCEHLQWGYWLSEFQWDEADGPNNGRRERFHIGTWVAGDLPDVAEVQGLTGTASYTGHVIGDVYNNGAQYLAAGKFRNTWDFGTRTGMVAITSFDAADYDGPVSSGNARDYDGIIVSGDRIGRVNGSFFKAGTDPAALTGGSITFSGPNYKASTTFAAQKD